MKIALHWFRRDLRVTDNTALHAALEENDLVWPVFIFDPKILTAPDIGAPRVAFLLDCLASLQKNLEAQGSPLIIRQGDIAEELPKLAQETGATAVHWNRDYEPYARRRDAAVEQRLLAQNITVKTWKDGVLHEADEVLKGDGTPYAVFTPYAKIWRARTKPTPLRLAKFKNLPDTPTPRREPLPTLAQLGFSHSAAIPDGGERAAHQRLKDFLVEPIFHYHTQRNFPAIPGTSRLSADLRFGTLSPRQIYAAAERARAERPSAKAEIDVFVTELIWREFYRQILWHFPHVERGAFRPKYDALKWENNERFFTAWCEGRTGYPMVDAAMRQLNTTGWMHNRLRMITAMFLTKDLLIDWKWGERYFMQKLVDGDLAANNGGWQWSAGTGTDAQPYFRIFNPNSQAQKFDPAGRFIERFVPEVNGFGYPAPIVDHGVQRLRTLAMFRAVA